MVIVVWVAKGDLRIVANIYKPCSVKACGATVECLSELNRWKFSTSSPYLFGIQLNHASFIDAIIPSTHILIEQKSLGKGLRQASS